MKKHICMLAALISICIAPLSAQDIVKQFDPDRPSELTGTVLRPFDMTVDETGNPGILVQSSNSLMALTGTFQIRYGTRLKTVPFHQTFGGAFVNLESGLKDGDTYIFPSMDDPNNPGQKLKYENLKVTGVVLADGRTWGEHGSYIRSQILGRARTAHRHLLRVQRLMRASDAAEFLENLKVGLFDAEILVQRSVEALLLEDGKLKDDHKEILQSEIQRLSRF